MKNLITAVIFGIALAGVSFAQTASKAKSEVEIAVVEFSPGANAVGMNADAKRQLQTNLAAALAKSDKFDVADVRHTQRASKDNLAAINGSSTAAAVKLGKQLGVKFVVTGTVTEYTPKDADGFGSATLKTRVIEVATGKIVHAGEASQRSAREMKTGSAVEMQAFVVKPAILKLAEGILELKL